MAGTAGTPHSPLPQRVDSIRRVCGTAASSSSPTLIWGGGGLSTNPPHGTARPGAAQGWETMPPPPSAPSPAAAPSHGAPAPRGCPSCPPPQRSQWLRRCCSTGRVCTASSGVPRQNRPRAISCGTSLQHMGAPGPSSPSVPSLALPGRDAAPVPLAQAAARGRRPWQSQCHRWPGEDAESGTGCAEGWGAALA